MKIKKKFTFAAIFFMVFLTRVFSQDEGQDFMRSLGKMYVVVAVILVIFLGLIFFLIRQEKKISKLEKLIKNN